eukprot:3169343-Alexandrium_andersonii.AAC.1
MEGSSSTANQRAHHRGLNAAALLSSSCLLSERATTGSLRWERWQASPDVQTRQCTRRAFCL